MQNMILWKVPVHNMQQCHHHLVALCGDSSCHTMPQIASSPPACRTMAVSHPHHAISTGKTLCTVFAESWPFTIRKLVGDKAVTNATGTQHTQARKILAPALTPKATQQYIPRIVEVAEELCTEWAEARQLKGEDAMKAFTFQVPVFVMLCIPLSCHNSVTTLR